MNFDISSDSDDGAELPFAQRVAKKAFGGVNASKNVEIKSKEFSDIGKTRPKKVGLSHAFSDSDSDDGLVSPPKFVRKEVELTPPPAFEDSENLPDTEPFVDSDGQADTEPLSDTDGLPANRQNSKTATVRSESSGRSSNKENKGSRKEAEKREKAAERLKQKEEKEALKANSKNQKEIDRQIARQTNKEQVHRYLVVQLDPAVVNSAPGPAILINLRQPPNGKSENVFQYEVKEQPVSGVVSWKRKVLCQGSTGQVEEYWQEEARCLLLISAEEVASKVVSGKLEEWAVETKAKLEGRHLTLVIWDYQQYFRAEENARERVKKAQVRGAAPAAKDMALMSGRASRYNMEEALVKLSIARVADYFTCSPEPGGGWQHCAGIVFHHTRAVAEAPLKMKKGLSGSGGFDFYAQEHSKNSLTPKNLPEYWKEVLKQVLYIGLHFLHISHNEIPHDQEFCLGEFRSRPGEEYCCGSCLPVPLQPGESFSSRRPRSPERHGGEEVRQCPWGEQEDWT